MNNQPQPPMPQAPQPAPQMPQPTPQPAGQFPQQPMGQYPQPQPKKNKTGLIVGIVLGSIALVATIVGIIIAAVALGGPTRADYSAAASELNKAVDEYNKVSSSMRYFSSSSTETEMKNISEKIKSAKTQVNETLDKLKDMKAIQRDKDVKAKYDELANKIDKFNSAADMLVELYDKLLPVYIKISKNYGYSASEATFTAYSQLADELDKVAPSIKNEYNKKFATDQSAALKEVAAAASDYYNSTNYDSAKYRRFSTATTKLTEVYRDWSSNVQKVSEESEIRNEINALGSILNDKQLGKK